MVLGVWGVSSICEVQLQRPLVYMLNKHLYIYLENTQFALLSNFSPRAVDSFIQEGTNKLTREML